MTSTIGPLLENCCNPCPCGGDDCKETCKCNIQSTNPKCLNVDTSECGVIKLEPACPKVTYVKGWENVVVKEVTPPDDCYMDWEDCGIKGWWEINSTDEKVKTCENDKSAWYLIDKIIAEEWSWIVVNAIWCDDPATDAYLELSVDPTNFPKWPNDKVSVTSWCEAKYLEDAIKVDSRLIKSSVEGCQLVLSDRFAYRKIYLQTDIVVDDIITWETPSYVFNDANSSWATVETAGWTKYAKDVDFVNGMIKIKTPWLYYVGFSWTMEIWSGIHAMRAQLYRWDASVSDPDRNKYTIIESRYSAPVGWPPYEVGGSPTGFKLDTPYRQLKTDVEWVIYPDDWYSASLGSYVSRMPVWWDTIEMFNAWDLVYFWAKASTQVDYHWDQMTQTPKTWHFAFLCKDSHRSWWHDIWGEPGLTIFVALLAPL